MTVSQEKLDTGVRICLKCNKKFDSLGKFNRICKECAAKKEPIKVTRMFVSDRKDVDWLQ